MAAAAAAGAGRVYRLKTIRLLVPANKAKPSPQIGQALGQLGINMMKFCKEFNAASTAYKDDVVCRVKLIAMSDGTYSFSIHPPSTSQLLLKACAAPKGAATPGSQIVGTIHAKQVYELAKAKKEMDPNSYMATVSVESIARQIVGQCRGMGIAVDCSRQ